MMGQGIRSGDRGPGSHVDLVGLSKGLADLPLGHSYANPPFFDTDFLVDLSGHATGGEEGDDAENCPLHGRYSFQELVRRRADFRAFFARARAGLTLCS